MRQARQSRPVLNPPAQTAERRVGGSANVPARAACSGEACAHIRCRSAKSNYECVKTCEYIKHDFVRQIPLPIPCQPRFGGQNSAAKILANFTPRYLSHCYFWSLGTLLGRRISKFPCSQGNGRYSAAARCG